MVGVCHEVQLKGMHIISRTRPSCYHVKVDYLRNCMKANTSLFTTHETHRPKHEPFHTRTLESLAEIHKSDYKAIKETRKVHSARLAFHFFKIYL